MSRLSKNQNYFEAVRKGGFLIFKKRHVQARVGGSSLRADEAGEQLHKAALEIEIRREIYTGKSTTGRLFVNGHFECYTLEDCARPAGVKVPGATCIPAGTYALAINQSSRFQRPMPQLLEVPGFEGVRIHPGNTNADTEGCILLGATRREDFVGGSRGAFRKLFGKLQAAEARGAEIRITVKDNGQSQTVNACSSPESQPV